MLPFVPVKKLSGQMMSVSIIHQPFAKTQVEKTSTISNVDAGTREVFFSKRISTRTLPTVVH